jgi:hypothetical protein
MLACFANPLAPLAKEMGGKQVRQFAASCANCDERSRLDPLRGSLCSRLHFGSDREAGTLRPTSGARCALHFRTSRCAAHRYGESLAVRGSAVSHHARGFAVSTAEGLSRHLAAGARGHTDNHEHSLLASPIGLASLCRTRCKRVSCGRCFSVLTACPMPSLPSVAIVYTARVRPLHGGARRLYRVPLLLARYAFACC